MRDDNPKHPYDLDDGPFSSDTPTHIHRVAKRIEGFMGGGIAGLAIGILALVVLTKFGFVPLAHGLYGIIGSIVFFAIIGAFWPKWFAWFFDLLTFW